MVQLETSREDSAKPIPEPATTRRAPGLEAGETHVVAAEARAGFRQSWRTDERADRPDATRRRAGRDAGVAGRRREGQGHDEPGAAVLRREPRREGHPRAARRGTRTAPTRRRRARRARGRSRGARRASRRERRSRRSPRTANASPRSRGPGARGARRGLHEHQPRGDEGRHRDDDVAEGDERAEVFARHARPRAAAARRRRGRGGAHRRALDAEPFRAARLARVARSRLGFVDVLEDNSTASVRLVKRKSRVAARRGGNERRALGARRRALGAGTSTTRASTGPTLPKRHCGDPAPAPGASPNAPRTVTSPPNVETTCAGLTATRLGGRGERKDERGEGDVVPRRVPRGFRQPRREPRRRRARLATAPPRRRAPKRQSPRNARACRRNARRRRARGPGAHAAGDDETRAAERRRDVRVRRRRRRAVESSRVGAARFGVARFGEYVVPRRRDGDVATDAPELAEGVADANRDAAARERGRDARHRRVADGEARGDAATALQGARRDDAPSVGGGAAFAE